MFCIQKEIMIIKQSFQSSHIYTEKKNMSDLIYGKSSNFIYLAFLQLTVMIPSELDSVFWIWTLAHEQMHISSY